jgi:hypothetical protein
MWKPHRFIATAGLIAGATLLPVTAAHAAPGCPEGVTPSFQWGYADLYARLGFEVMGAPTTCEYGDGQGLGNTIQFTTRGLAYYRRSTNTPAFVSQDGVTHYALVPPEHFATIGYQPTVRILVTWTTADVDPPLSALPGQGSPDWCNLDPSMAQTPVCSILGG